jgi:spore cortex biosynthesis protein YabQ
MGISILGQTGLLLSAALLGFALGAVYDIFRIFRVATRSGRVAVFVLDLLYWLICAAVTFVFLLFQNDGRMRALSMLAQIGGAALYYYTIGRLVIKRAAAASVLAKRKARAAANAAAKAVAGPMGRFGRAAGYKIAKGGRVAGRFIKKEHKLFKIRLKVHQKMMYNLLRSTKKRKASENEE